MRSIDPATTQPCEAVKVSAALSQKKLKALPEHLAPARACDQPDDESNQRQNENNQYPQCLFPADSAEQTMAMIAQISRIKTNSPPNLVMSIISLPSRVSFK